MERQRRRAFVLVVTLVVVDYSCRERDARWGAVNPFYRSSGSGIEAGWLCGVSSGIYSAEDAHLARLALIRGVAERWFGPRRRRDKRASLGLTSRIVRACGGDGPGVLAHVEIEFLIEELPRRGRREDGARVTEADLRAVGVLL